MLGLHWNRVSLKGTPGANKDTEEIVLSCTPLLFCSPFFALLQCPSYLMSHTHSHLLPGTQDEFFARLRYANWGDTIGAMQTLMEQFKKDSMANDKSKIVTIEDMQNLVVRV